MVELALERQAAIRAQAEVRGISGEVRAEGVRVSGQVRALWSRGGPVPPQSSTPRRGTTGSVVPSGSWALWTPSPS